MKHPILATLAVVVAGTGAWALLQSLRGPVLAGHEVVAAPLVQTVVASGRVVSVAQFAVGSEVSGVVLERRVQEGDSVQPGDVLALLRADDLDAALREAEAELARLQQSTRPQAQAELRAAEARLEQASRETLRREDLFARQLIAREDLEQARQAEIAARSAAEQAQLSMQTLVAGNPAEAAAHARVASAKAQLAKATIRAQVAGTVLSRNAEPGDFVQPGQVLFEIAPANTSEILVPLDEKNLEVLALGQQATCFADAFPAQPFPATLSFIAPAVDAQRGTVDIRLVVDPLPEFLRNGMTVSVNIETGRRERALVVPNTALMNVDGARASVWRVRDGRAEPHAVQLGLRGISASEVSAGLEAGDWVLADASSELVAGARVRVVAGTAAINTQDRELPVNLD